MTQKRGLSRRGFCLCCIGATTLVNSGAWLTPREAFAYGEGIVDMIRAEAARAPIHVHRLRGNIAVLEGSGGNIGVFVGPDGKLLVDAGIAASRPRIADALGSLGPAPVTQLINTHWHFDHANGNEWLSAQGAVIAAHVNTRKHLMTAQRVEDWHVDFPASPANALPTEIISDTHDIEFGSATIRLKHHSSAHTDGDISVEFAEANILHTGDLYWNGIYPFHRLFDGWKYRWDYPRGRSPPLANRRRHHRDTWPRAPCQRQGRFEELP
jgi:glyoxylase-like metal-dependent hydrolase (beta-lactamase superfamily II)